MFSGLSEALAAPPRCATGCPVALLVRGGNPMAERGAGRGKRPTAVREALRSYLAKSGLATRLAQAQVMPDWPRLVGPQIADVTAPESVTHAGTLFVRVAMRARMHELQ